MIAVVGVATNPASWFERDFPAAAADAAAAAAGPHGRVLATSPFADWLLWTHPELAGRVAFDARFELLTPFQLERAARFLGRSGSWTATANRYRVLVLGKQDDSQLRAALLRSGMARVVRIDRSVVVSAPHRLKPEAGWSRGSASEAPSLGLSAVVRGPQFPASSQLPRQPGSTKHAERPLLQDQGGSRFYKSRRIL